MLLREMSRRALVAVAVAGGVLSLVLAPRLPPWWREHRIRSVHGAPDVVLITLDTTRADKLGAYEGDPRVSPNLDDVARHGVLFEQAISQVPLTLPSHSSLMTGLLPPRHGVRDNAGFVLRDGIPTLAESFARAGYQTAAFVSAFVLDHRFGLARGFGEYVDEVPPAADDGVAPNLASCRAGVTIDRVVAWLARAPKQPVFLWVHLYDPHAPYDPPEPFASRFAARPYDGEIAYMDQEIGRLRAALGQRGRPTLLAAVGDHGEALGEHREKTHSYYIYGGTQRVPLLISMPGVLPEGRAVRPVVRVVDLMPTLLDIAGLPVPPGLDGKTLVPLVTGRQTDRSDPAYMESFTARFHWGARELLGLRTATWLYVRAPRPELYDLRNDPGETVNLAAENAGTTAALDAELQTILATAKGASAPRGVDAETASRLQALGYVAAGGETPPTGELPDAKDNAELLGVFGDAEELFEKGDVAGALEGFRKAAAMNPRAVAPRSRLAQALLRLQRYPEAREAYQALAAEFPQEEGYRVGLMRALSAGGRKEEALELARKGLEAAPGSSSLHVNAALVLMQGGRMAEAETEFRSALALSPRDAGARLGLAKTLVALAKPKQAAEAYAELIESSPRSPQAREGAKSLMPLADQLASSGDLELARRAYRAAHQAGVSSDQSYLNLALIFRRLGPPDALLATLQEGIRAHPTSVDLRYRAGRALLEAGKGPAAETELRKALELDTNRQDVRLSLALATQAAGKRSEAESLLREVAQAHPGSKEAVRAGEALARLQAAP
jgi:arylsulfatase A-like enzyme/tetratricopeptide (TPR) repeat protein